MAISAETASKPWWHRLRSGMSLRVLMIVVLVIGGGLGWVVYRERVQRQAVAAIQAAGGRVYYEWNTPLPRVKSPPKWLVDAIGPDYLGNIVEVQLSGQKDKTDDALLAWVGCLRRLEGLSLSDCGLVTDAGLAELANLSLLERLDLNSTSVKGPGLIHLKGMTQLKELRLMPSPITDADLAYLAGLTALEHLDLRSPLLTDVGMANLARLTNLKRLQIVESPITSAGLIHLGGMKHLKNLIVAKTKVNSLEPIGHLREIEVLFLPTTIDDAGLSPIVNFRALQQLALPDAPISDAGLTYVRDLTSLTNLGLNGTHITDAGIGQTANLLDLRSLGLTRTAVTDAGLARLPDFPKRWRIDLENTAITDQGLNQIKGLKQCDSLNVRKTKVTAAGAASIQSKYPTMRIVY